MTSVFYKNKPFGNPVPIIWFFKVYIYKKSTLNLFCNNLEKNQFITGGQILFKNSSVLFYWKKIKSLIQQ